MNTQEAKIVLETALICAQEPLKLGELRKLFADDISADTVRTLLEGLKQDWSGRGVELVALASSNISNLQLNSDGSIRNLNGVGVVTSSNRTGRQYDEREFRIGLRFAF